MSAFGFAFGMAFGVRGEVLSLWVVVVFWFCWVNRFVAELCTVKCNTYRMETTLINHRADLQGLTTSHPHHVTRVRVYHRLHVLLLHATASAEVTFQFNAPPPPSNHNTSRAPRTPSRRSARPSPGSAGGSPRQARRRARAAPARKIYSTRPVPGDLGMIGRAGTDLECSTSTSS